MIPAWIEDYYELTLNETDLRGVIEDLDDDLKFNVRAVDAFMSPLYLTPPNSEYDFLQLNYLTVVSITLDQTAKMKFEII